MLSFYLSTVIIWFIIILCEANIFSKKFIERYQKYITKNASRIESVTLIFLISAVPILRAFMAFMIIYITSCSEDVYRDIIEKLQ